MQIISHRGFWTDVDQRNSKEAFIKSFCNGFGIETDLRDLDGDIVVSHDMPLKIQKPLTFNELLILRSSFLKEKTNLPLALNVKSDGIQKAVISLLERFKVNDYFFFDMSIPDMVVYSGERANLYTRQSELEKEPVLYKNSIGVWLDAFESFWYDDEVIKRHLNASKKVAIVSFELHKRSYIDQWSFIKCNNFHMNRNIILCTDFPVEAKLFFYEK